MTDTLNPIQLLNPDGGVNLATRPDWSTALDSLEARIQYELDHVEETLAAMRRQRLCTG